APRAVKRTTPRSNHRHGAFTVMRLPCREVLFHVQNVAIGPGEAIQIRYRRPRRGAERAPILLKEDPSDLFEILHSLFLEPGNEFLQGGLALIDSDDVDAVFKVKIAPFGSIRATDQHELDAVRLRDFRQPEDILACDDIGVEPDDS